MSDEADKANRRFVRVDVKLPVTYRSPSSTEAKPSITRDVGGAGICLLANEEFPKGTRLDVEFRLPSVEDSIRFIGEVVWCGPNPKRPRSFFVGLSFVTIKPEDHQAVMRYCIALIKQLPM